MVKRTTAKWVVVLNYLYSLFKSEYSLFTLFSDTWFYILLLKITGIRIYFGLCLKCTFKHSTWGSGSYAYLILRAVFIYRVWVFILEAWCECNNHTVLLNLIEQKTNSGSSGGDGVQGCVGVLVIVVIISHADWYKRGGHREQIQVSEKV